MIEDQDLITKFDKDLKSAYSGLSEQYENTIKCQKFYSGDMMDYKGELGGDGRRKKKIMVQFNKVKPYVNSVKGFMAQNRRKIRYMARVMDESQRVAYSDHVNSYAEYIRENMNVDQVETQQDGDMLINGYGAIETCLSFGDGYASNNPDGEILSIRLDPLSVFWDPSATATNLLDARYVGYKKEYDLEEAKNLFDAGEEDFEQAESDLEGRKEYLPGGGPYTAVVYDVDWSNRQKNLVNVYFYQWYEIEDYYRCDNPLQTIGDPVDLQFAMIRMQEIIAMGEEDSIFSFDPSKPILDCNEAQMIALKQFFNDQIEFKKFKRKAYFGAVISGRKVFTKYRLLTQQGFTIKFKTGDRDESRKIWTGMVNSMMEPVLYFNKALTELLYSIAAAAKGGVMYEKQAIENIRKFEAEYAKTDSNVEVQNGALSGGKIKPKREAYVPTGLENIIQISDASIADVNGIDKSFLGSSENRSETAALQRQRIKQVTSVLACYFDAVTLYQRVDGRILIDLIRVLVKANPSAMFRVIGQNGASELQQVDIDKFMAEYDISVQEAPDSATEKQERVMMLNNIATSLIAAGDVTTAKMVIGISLSDIDSLDSSARQKLVRALIPEDDSIDPAYVKQLEAAIQQMQDKANELQLKNLASNTMLNMARVEKTQAEVETEHAKTAKTLEEAAQKSAETTQIQRADAVTLNI